MIAPALPETETERLADLHALQLLDTPSEQRFDRIVNLTKAVLNAPIAYIALIDSDRQWFKAKAGMCNALSETPRDQSFCGHAILQDTPLIVEDALKDPRFFDNPMVIGEPGVRFYAGHPLKTEAGHNIATLCVVDTEPRSFSSDEMDKFHRLAELAEQELNMLGLIAAQREIIDTRQALAESQRALANELSEAADYVKHFLPPSKTCDSCGVAIDYQFIASSRLGGDLLGFHDIDDDHQAFWLLDVTGHGVGASLLSVSAGNAIRSGQLAADPRDPAALLATLNNAFPMERNGNKFFTIWYGVYEHSTRTLRYAAAGHHPALLIEADGSTKRLGVPGLMIGVVPDTPYETQTATIDPGGRLYLFSDGLYEIRGGDDNQLLGLDGVAQVIRNANCKGCSEARAQQIIRQARAYQHGQEAFADDVSLLEVEFVG
ncbi:MAG: PP2C family protein-serine/threonine phosphatase [Phycisphaeraceae bacterium]